jgi:hypothetical protein
MSTAPEPSSSSCPPSFIGPPTSISDEIPRVVDGSNRRIPLKSMSIDLIGVIDHTELKKEDLDVFREGEVVGMHYITTKRNIMMMGLGGANSSIVILFTKPGINKDLGGFVQNPNIPKAGFHLERVACLLYTNYGYQMESFWEINDLRVSWSEGKQAGIIECFMGLPRKPDVVEGQLLEPHEWIKFKSWANLKSHHFKGLSALAQLCHWIGTVRVVDRGARMAWSNLTKNYPKLIDVWTSISLNATAVLGAAEEGHEVRFGEISLE